jgi:hypothetical protein
MIGALLAVLLSRSLHRQTDRHLRWYSWAGIPASFP